MADWKTSIFQIISTLVGSGLILFVFNNLVADLNQANVKIDVEDFDDSISSSNSSNSNGQVKFQTVAINNGRSSATNLRLTLSYPNYNITQYGTAFQSENMTFSYYNSTLIAEIGRLSSGSAVAINTTGICINKNTDNNNTKCLPYYIVTASYDQGSIFKTNMDSPILNTDVLLNVHSRNELTILTTTLAIASFVIALSFKRIRRFKKRLDISRFVFYIVREIVSIRDTLEKNILSKKIFPFEIWLSKDENDKRHVFNDYDDYNYIDEFYTKLKERDNELSRKRVDKETVKKSNEECLALATDTIENVNWVYYQDIEDRKYYLPITILISIPCTLIVFFAFEVYKVPFLLFVLGLPNQYHIVTYYFFTTLARTLVSFTLAREIINFQTSFSYDIGVNNDILSFFLLSKKQQVELLIFSFLILGLPILPILQGGFQFDLTEFGLIRYENPPLAYETFLSLVALDIIRFSILTFVIPRFVMKRNLRIKSDNRS